MISQYPHFWLLKFKRSQPCKLHHNKLNQCLASEGSTGHREHAAFRVVQPKPKPFFSQLQLGSTYWSWYYSLLDIIAKWFIKCHGKSLHCCRIEVLTLGQKVHLISWAWPLAVYFWNNYHLMWWTLLKKIYLERYKFLKIE